MSRSHRLVNVASVLLLTSAAANSSAQTATRFDQAVRTKMDEAIRRCLREDGTPSASVAVVRNGKIVYTAAFGYAVLRPETMATTTTPYQLASISKTFTAQAILLLEADGRLSLDDKVSKWYPTLTDSANITLRELLNHTSGYPDHYPESYPAGPRERRPHRTKLLRNGAIMRFCFPGTQFHYSNLEYEIAGRIVEKVSGIPLFRFIQDRIFEPLGMNASVDLDYYSGRQYSACHRLHTNSTCRPGTCAL